MANNLELSDVTEFRIIDVRPSHGGFGGSLGGARHRNNGCDVTIIVNGTSITIPYTVYSTRQRFAQIEKWVASKKKVTPTRFQQLSDYFREVSVG